MLPPRGNSVRSLLCPLEGVRIEPLSRGLPTLLVEMEIDPVALTGTVRNTYKPSHPIIDVNGLKAGLRRIAGNGFCQAASSIVGLGCDPLCAVRITEASCKNK